MSQSGGNGGSGAPSGSNPPNGGNRGRNRGNRGGRGSRWRQGAGARSDSVVFQGREPSLKGHVYDESNSEQFIKTSKEIMNWVGREYTTYTGAFTDAIMTLNLDMPTEPEDPPAADNIAFECWKLELKKFHDKENAYNSFLARLFSVVLGQCTEAMEDRLRSTDGWLNAQQNGLALLTLIKTVAFSFEDQTYLPDALLDVKEEFYKLHQHKHESLQHYYDRFKNHVEVMEEVGVDIVDASLVDSVAEDNGHAGAPSVTDRVEALDRTLATRFLRGANQRYCAYLAELRNAALNGNFEYPTTLNRAYNILQRRVDTSGGAFDAGTDGIAFVMEGEVVAGRNGRVHNHIECHRCNQRGHFADQCPSGQEGGTEQGMVFICSHSSQTSGGIPPQWILLDSEANVDLFQNRHMLRNIRRVNSSLTVRCNAGSRVTQMMGDLPGYPNPVWYSPYAIANIMSLNNVKSIPRWRVTYSSSGGDAFRVMKDDGMVVEFGNSTGGNGPDGLYRYDATENGLTGTVLVTTVAENKSRFTNEEYSRAERARTIQKVIGRPSTSDFIRYITKHQIPNCPVTRADVVNAENIFGPDVGSLKGKTVRQDPPQVRIQHHMLPPDMMERHQLVTVCADIVHVNGIPFLITISRGIKFGTVEELSTRSKGSVLGAMDRMLAIYSAGGFQVRHILMDGEFEPYRANLAGRGVALNTTARDEHVGDIERFIRTVKERVRSIFNSLPFKRIPHRMVIEMVKSSVFWRNSFPVADGISDDMSPRTIVTGAEIDFNRHCKFEFGEYVQTHEEHDNSMGARTVGALALRPTGNAQGGHYFFSLSTGRRLNRLNATRVPMPDEVIDRVHILARRQNANRGLVFGDRRQEEHDDELDDGEYDDADDSTYAPSDDEIDDSSDDEESFIPEDDEDEEDGVAPPDHEGDDQSAAGAGSTGVPDVDEESTGVASDLVGTTGVEPNVESQLALDADMNHRYGPRSSQHALRPRRRPNYTLVSSGTHDLASEEVLATPQMGMKKGIQTFGEPGVEAVRKEMQQLHDRKVMEPRLKTELTPEQRREALAYLMFLKRKRCGKIKGRGCADGRKQRAYINPEDATAPTVSTEAVLLTAMIDAMEGREVAVIDIPGAFMQADMDELVHVRFNGRMAELLLEIDPEMYQPYITVEKGETVLYVELLKALYGTLRAARLFWERLSKTLEEWGFKANPYDRCVMNKMVNGKQLTVAWHVDDLKVSHVEVGVVDKFIDDMEGAFGKEAPLSKSRGKVHDYLGMVLDFSKPGELCITMIDYIKMILAEAPAEMRGSATTPAGAHLFNVNESAPKLLDAARAKIFHRVVMQLLYLSQRARPDIRTAISFLCKRVTKCDEDDYKKLARVMQYLDSTIDLPLVLRVDGSGNLYWYVDASFGVHHDMKGHTGGTFTMGQGSIYSTSVGQKSVARSSTESELIGVHDVLPQMLWTMRFLEEQGFKVNGTILYQDNKSAILLEKNGMASSSRRTRHLLLRYYFVKEHVDSGAITIQHCPTREMIADYYTKPVQGSLFGKLRDAIMNIDPSSPYHSSHRSVLHVSESESSDVCSDVSENVSSGGVSHRALTPLLEHKEEEGPLAPHSL